MYYRINSTKISHLEYWWGTRSPFVVFGWLTKWLGVPLPSSSDDPNVESLIPFETPVELVPPEVLARFQPLLTELATLGFQSPFYHVIHDRFHQTKIYWASLPHRSGQAWARIHHRIWTQAQPVRSYLFPVFYSALQDGRFLISSAAGKQDMLAAPTCRFVHRPKATATDLWSWHQRDLETEQLRTSVRPVRTTEELRAAIEAHHVVTRDFHVKRGVFVPMKPEEERQNTAPPPLMSSGGQHAEVLLQLEALQKQKPSWGNALMILVISAVVFFASSSTQGSWKFALGLIPILLFHEAGHYLAMRLFNYRNLRMFFIPFFGAAVTGSNYNVPGWKKAIVSLMGPVPGIAVGIGVGVLGLFLHQPLLIKGAFITLFLNAYNLLPVLPLDGGWVLHTTLFCRHPLLDVGFRVLAAIGLIVLGLTTQARFLPYLAIPMFMALPVAYQTARIAAALRGRNLPQVPDDVQTIPDETANTIVTEIKAAFPKQQNTKTLAQLSLNVFELLNARPPHWAATLGILFVHGASLALAVVFGIVFAVGRDGNLRDGLQTAALMNDEQLMKFDATVTHLGPAFAAAAPRTMIVINLPKAKPAAEVYTSLTTRMPTNAALTRFGQTLLLALPAADPAVRTKWVREAEQLSTNYFVSTTNFGVQLSVSGIAPDQATADKTRQALNELFGVPWTLNPIPPWASVDRRTPAERAAHDQARASYLKLQNSFGTLFTNAAHQQISQRLGRAQKQGDTDAVKELQAQLRKSQSDMEAEVFARARTNVAHVPAVISFMEKERAMNARFFALKKPTVEQTKALQEERTALLEELAPHLGTVAGAGKSLATPADREATRFGYVGGSQSIVMIQGLALAASPEAAVPIVNWLQKQGYKNIRYRFRLAGYYGGDDD